MIILNICLYGVENEVIKRKDQASWYVTRVSIKYSDDFYLLSGYLYIKMLQKTIVCKTKKSEVLWQDFVKIISLCKHEKQFHKI